MRKKQTDSPTTTVTPTPSGPSVTSRSSLEALTAPGVTWDGESRRMTGETEVRTGRG